ncbi:MAG: flagellar biosynthetic protein FliQ [Microvirga sp.]|jgi:flagellar biosynthetic protein FliQ|nr:flagellar biosynthetic protein FliQ [Microvirga sp.]
MNPELTLRVAREALILILLISGGPMLASMLVGFVVGIFQATTQIQEQTLSYVPKLVAVFLSLLVLGPWMLTHAVKFARAIFDMIATVH